MLDANAQNEITAMFSEITHLETRGKTRNQAKYSPMDAVLIVDDEALIRWSVAESLEAAGYQVLEAATAREALAWVQDRSAAISTVILDLKLPDSSDLSLLRRVRQIRPACRIILMTAYGTPEMLEEALESGATDVLCKPFDMSRIVAAVGQEG